MRNKDRRPQFAANNTMIKRANKIAALAQLNTPDSRKERKSMNVHVYGHLSNTNVHGFYAGKHGNGNHPVRIKINSKNRPMLSAAKWIMSGRV